MRALALALAGWSAASAGMVIDPVDPAFGVVIVAMAPPPTAAEPSVRGLALRPGGGIALLLLDGATLGDGTPCHAPRLAVVAGDGRLEALRDAPALGVPACLDPASAALAVASDGSFYLAGRPESPPAAPRVWKLTAQGAPDPTYAATLPVALATFLRPTLQVLAGGALAIGGPALVDLQGSRAAALAVARLLPSGAPDTTYGAQGLALAVPANRPIHAAEGGGMVVDAAGAAFVAGNVFEDDAGAKIYTDATVARFDAGGHLDTSYGDAGFAIPLRDASTFAESLAVVAGEAYLAGVQGRDSPFAFVAKLRTDGILDLRFASAGVAGTDSFAVTPGAPQIAVDGDRRTWMALTDGRGHLRIARLRADGTPDSDFGQDGAAYVAASGWNVAGVARLVAASNGAFVALEPFAATDGARRAAGVARLADAGGHRADIAAGTAIIYYHAGLDHYFMTANPAEQARLDGGLTAGWQRTGQTFRVVTSDTVDPELTPVCRYYGRPEAHLDSHFFSAAPDECAQVAQRFAASWTLETDRAFAVQAADRASGDCPRGSEKVYRAFDNRADANHYYGVLAIAPPGWTYEGYGAGTLPTAFCAPLL